MSGGNFPASNQEATMELVEKIKPETVPGGVAATSGSPSPGLDPVSLVTIVKGTILSNSIL